jgi:hypothetical protein
MVTNNDWQQSKLADGDIADSKSNVVCIAIEVGCACSDSGIYQTILLSI